MNYNWVIFREFTIESIERIKQNQQLKAQRLAEFEFRRKTLNEIDTKELLYQKRLSKADLDDFNREPDPRLEVGLTLPEPLKIRFPEELIGKPIEEIDPYYAADEGFMVINKNKTIFRFNSTRACFLFSPFNIFRHVAIRILTHPLFSTMVMLTILANCVFMTLRNPPEVSEYVFTVIYTFEALTKCIARGFILQKHTFLRDPWNWLDFIVIVFAYITFFINLGKVAVLRTFRVLRALKTVAVVPGLKTIVNALIQSFIALRDVTVLSAFILSIFALIGLQLYMGILRQKCVPSYDSFLNTSNLSNFEFNVSYSAYLHEIDNETNWYKENDIYVLCGNGSGSSKCPDGYVCWKDRGISPDYGYTNFDNYGWAMLACFRLMTQDYWENLYLLVLSAAGRYHFLYFVAVIFFGSFYLVNLILATVSMSYLEQQKKTQAEEMKEDDAKAETEKQSRSLLLLEGLHNEDGKKSIDQVEHSNDFNQNRKDDETSSMKYRKNRLNSVDKISYSKKDVNEDLNESGRLLEQEPCVLVFDEGMERLSLAESKTLEQTLPSPNTNLKPEPLLVKLFRMYCCQCQCQSSIFQKFRSAVAFVILDAFVDLFITLCIVLNTLFMALDHHGQSERMTMVLTMGNYVFTGIFTAESFLKIIALTPANFFKNGWNVFDFIIVSISLIELGLANVKGLSVLRSFRLLRVFKLAKSWQTLNRLMIIIGRSLGALGNLTFVLVIVIFIFAVMGMQLFGQKYAEHFGNDIPRWNFFDFFHSFMIVFRVLCGEWIESMWVCLECAGWPCIPFFLLTFFVGNLVILNLFLALLLASFGSNVLTDTEEEDNKIGEAIGRIQRFVRFIIDYMTRSHKRRNIPHNETTISNTDATQTSVIPVNDKDTNWVTSNPMDDSKDSSMYANDISFQNESIEMEILEKDHKKSREESEALDVPPDCCPKIISQHFNRFSRFIPRLIREQWMFARKQILRFVEHSYFEWFIIVSILVSSATLAIEDIHTRQQPKFSAVLAIFDKVFTIIFTIELILKWFAYGIRKYFTSGWNILDFIIVVVSVLGTILDFLGIADIPAFKSMRTLRALRPLKALSRFEGIRVVVNALFGAIPAIFNVLLVCLVFWLIFSIMGVQLFGGRFYKCVYTGTHDRVNISENVKNKSDCLSKNFTWENSRVNFDNVLQGYLALFQVATFKGWIEIMADATDAKELDTQPEYETNVYILLFFVFFIIFGAFFTLNLFIGVVIDNFNQQKKILGEDGSVDIFMTESQKKYCNAMKKMSNKKPTKALPRPKFAFARFLFDLTTSQKFDIFIMACIFLNMLCMCLEHHNQSPTYDAVLAFINHIFVAIFVAECCMKLIALNLKYFTIPWNIFDFVIVLASIFGQTLGEVMAKYFVNPTLLRVARVARVGRILRLVKGAKGIRALLFALAVSLPALFNIGLLLFLVMFIYAIFGMSFFGYVRKSAGITDIFNFETFPNSIIVLFQMCTTAGWSGVYQALTNDQPPDCDPTLNTPSNKGDCGDTAIATPFLVSYVIITSLVVINMYIAVILENFSQAQEDVQQGLTDDDYDMYYEKWQRVDPSGSQFIPYDQLSDFVDDLEPPLRISKPNHAALVILDIPICENDRMHCVDILDGLTKYYLGTLDPQVMNAEVEVPIDIKKDRPKDYHPITTTLQRQREQYLYRIGWNAFLSNVQRSRNRRQNHHLITDK